MKPQMLDQVPDGFRQAVDKRGRPYDMYFVSEYGVVISAVERYFKPRILRQNRSGKNRYWSVQFRIEPNKYRRVSVHVLVACAWVGLPTRRKRSVNHKDGDKANNYFRNLEWGTHKHNLQHASQMGLMRRGTGCPIAKLTPEAVREIRRMSSEGKFQSEIAESFGVSQSNISHIILGKSWSHVI